MAACSNCKPSTCRSRRAILLMWSSEAWRATPRWTARMPTVSSGSPFRLVDTRAAISAGDARYAGCLVGHSWSVQATLRRLCGWAHCGNAYRGHGRPRFRLAQVGKCERRRVAARASHATPNRMELDWSPGGENCVSSVISQRPCERQKRGCSSSEIRRSAALGIWQNGISRRCVTGARSGRIRLGRGLRS